MSDLFEHYQGRCHTATTTAPLQFDETFDSQGNVRPTYADLFPYLRDLSLDDLRASAQSLARTYIDQGVTFDFAGEERPFPLDPIPRIISAEEWAPIEAGVKQRVLTLEAFLADMYGEQHALKDGIIPPHVVVSSKNFVRQAADVTPSNGVRIQVAGIDLIRDGNGDWRVLEDNVRVPSGVSYVISNRKVMAQTAPDMFATGRVLPVAEYCDKLLHALIAAAPAGVRNPTVVVLTPGIYNSAYYEHTLLARLMGVELVEGRDLFTTGGRVFMRTTEGPTRVDVIYRRVDDDYLDPLEFRSTSILGTPGLMLAARLGQVTIANAVGNGLADDKLMYTYIPDLTRYYLHEEPILRNVDTWRLEDPGALEEVLERLPELVVKPVDGSGGKGIVMGPSATEEELAILRQQLQHNPRGWIAQPVIQLSTSPTLVEDGVRPRHVDLRPFAVNDGTDVWVLPGGLTRVALPQGRLIVNSSQGGGSKDTWVVTETSQRVDPEPEPQDAELPSSRLHPLDLSYQDWALDKYSGQQQQQQQEKGPHHA